MATLISPATVRRFGRTLQALRKLAQDRGDLAAQAIMDGKPASEREQYRQRLIRSSR